MRGKYSPTVSAAYMADQEWWYKYSGSDKPTAEYVQYDPDGYDSYGYDKNDIDRAGNLEHEYYADNEHGENDRYNQALDDWTFDGTKPALKKTDRLEQLKARQREQVQSEPWFLELIDKVKSEAWTEGYNEGYACAQNELTQGE